MAPVHGIDLPIDFLTELSRRLQRLHFGRYWIFKKKKLTKPKHHPCLLILRSVSGGCLPFQVEPCADVIVSAARQESGRRRGAAWSPLFLIVV